MFEYIYVYCIIVAWVYETEKIILIKILNMIGKCKISKW